jgi:hypothetical protein
MSNQPSAHFLPSLQPLDEPKLVDAFDGIIKAFDKFPIVALGEAHHLQEESDFIAQLIRRADFSAKVDAIVVDFHNLEQKYPQSFFIIMPYFGFLERNDELEPRIAKWPKPSLAVVKETWLGAQAGSLIMAVTIRSLGRAPYNPYAETTIEELADAFLYLGPSDSLTTSGPSPEIYQDEAYVKELKRRHILVRGREMDPGATTFTLPRKYRDFLKLRGR